MCDLASAVIGADARVYAYAETQHHGEIARRAELPPALAAAVLSPLWGHEYFRYELNPPDWRKGRGGRWYDGAYRHMAAAHEGLSVPSAPQNIIDAGDKLTQELVTTEGPVESMPWITIVRSGRHHLGTVDYLVTFGNAQVEVDEVRKQVWALDGSRVEVRGSLCAWHVSGDGTMVPYSPARAEDNAEIIVPDGHRILGASQAAGMARDRAALARRWHCLSPMLKMGRKPPLYTLTP